MYNIYNVCNNYLYVNIYGLTIKLLLKIAMTTHLGLIGELTSWPYSDNSSAKKRKKTMAARRDCNTQWHLKNDGRLFSPQELQLEIIWMYGENVGKLLLQFPTERSFCWDGFPSFWTMFYDGPSLQVFLVVSLRIHFLHSSRQVSKKSDPRTDPLFTNPEKT